MRFDMRLMRPPILIAILLLAAVLAIAVVALENPSGQSSSPGGSAESSSSQSDLEGSLVPAGVFAHNFTLTDQYGEAVSMSQYRGKVVILTFLSASCGKVCIVLAQQIRGALDELGRSVPVLAVSTDPAADTQARTRRFLSEVSLTARMQYLTGPQRLLSSIWRSYGITSTNASKVNLSDGTALVLLIDKLGRERISFLLEQLTPEGLSTQVRRLLAEAP